MKEGESFKAQQLRTQQLAVDIAADGIASFEVFLFMTFLLRHSAEYYWTRISPNTVAS